MYNSKKNTHTSTIKFLKFHIMVAFYINMSMQKIITYMQQRIESNVVGSFGLLQVIADGLILLVKKTLKLLNPQSATLKSLIISFTRLCALFLFSDIVYHMANVPVENLIGIDKIEPMLCLGFGLTSYKTLSADSSPSSNISKKPEDSSTNKEVKEIKSSIIVNLPYSFYILLFIGYALVLGFNFIVFNTMYEMHQTVSVLQEQNKLLAESIFTTQQEIVTAQAALRSSIDSSHEMAQIRFRDLFILGSVILICATLNIIGSYITGNELKDDIIKSARFIIDKNAEAIAKNADKGDKAYNTLNNIPITQEISGIADAISELNLQLISLEGHTDVIRESLVKHIKVIEVILKEPRVAELLSKLDQTPGL